MFAQSKKIVGLIAVLTLVVLTGCTMNGGGIVDFFGVDTGVGPGIPTEASIAVNLNCNDNKNAWRSNINIVDNTNGAHINAHIKEWIPVSEFGADSCEEAAAIVEAQGASLALGILTSQGNQENGLVQVVVGAPGVSPAECGDLQPIIVQAFEDTPDSLPGGEYYAGGCLAQGKINFK